MAMIQWAQEFWRKQANWVAGFSFCGVHMVTSLITVGSGWARFRCIAMAFLILTRFIGYEV